MSLLKFKVSWDEDDATYRNIEIISSQSFFDLHECIKKSLQLPADMHAMLYMVDNKGRRQRALSSEVEKNLRDAPALSMKKTPVGALIQDPEQAFEYECKHPKSWLFNIEIISITPFDSDMISFPRCIKSEGISPINFAQYEQEKKEIFDTQDAFDMMDTEDGFGEEGEGGEEFLTDSEDI